MLQELCLVKENHIYYTHRQVLIDQQIYIYSTFIHMFQTYYTDTYFWAEIVSERFALVLLFVNCKTKQWSPSKLIFLGSRL